MFQGLPATVSNADAEFDKLYKEMKACGDLAAAAEAELKADEETKHAVDKGYEYVSTLPPLQDPSVILTSPKSTRKSDQIQSQLNTSSCSSTLVPDESPVQPSQQNVTTSDYAESFPGDHYKDGCGSTNNHVHAKAVIQGALDKRKGKVFSNILPLKPTVRNR